VCKSKLVRCALLFLFLVSTGAKADIKAGPIGGIGGTEFEENLEVSERICGIYLRNNDERIFSIQLEVCDDSGNRYLTTRHGGSDGEESYIPLAEDDVIDSIWVTKIPINGASTVVGLGFNLSKSGWLPFGSVGVQLGDNRVSANGSFYEIISLPDGYEVHGIIGNADSDLDAFGVLFRAIPGSEVRGDFGHIGNVGGGENADSFGGHIQNSAPLFEYFCGVKIRHGSRIDAIQMEVCSLDGTSTFHERHGGSGGSESYFKLDSDEYFVSVTGWRGRKYGADRIFGLQFITNTGRVSPTYGSVTSDGFELNAPEGYIITNISGASRNELEAIGIGFTLIDGYTPPRLGNVVAAADFESDFGAWTQSGASDSWLRKSGATSSNGTGPSAAAEGSTYAYFETSRGYAYYSEETAHLLSPTFGSPDMRLQFSYHMYGVDIGYLYVDVLNNTTWINDVWVQSGEQNDSSDDPWKDATIDLSEFSNPVQVRIRAVASGGYHGDIAIDDLSLSSSYDKLGGVSISSMCKIQTGDNSATSVLTTSRFSSYAAYQWKCEVSSGVQSGLDMGRACRDTYTSTPDAFAYAANLHDAYSWGCYSSH
jgi:hypothetical protein